MTAARALQRPALIETRALGTDLRIEGHGAAQALSEVQRLEGVLSRFADTPLSRLNSTGGAHGPPRELYEAVRYALKVAADTGGLLTPAIREALRAAGYDQHPGSPSASTAAAPVPDVQNVICTPDHIALPGGLTLDLGGTGKGWIAQQASAHLLPPFVLDAGGDMVIEQLAPFSLELEDPFGAAPRVLELPAGRWGVATSSVLKRAWAGGHHLIDPRTGRPLQSELLQVTAICRTVLDAEVFAKLAFFGPEEIRRQQVRRLLLALYAFDRQGRLLHWQGHWEAEA